MATAAIKYDADDIQLVPPIEKPDRPDRLPAMLFLAALIHGILIIGVTFNPYLLDEFSRRDLPRGHDRGGSRPTHRPPGRGRVPRAGVAAGRRQHRRRSQAVGPARERCRRSTTSARTTPNPCWSRPRTRRSADQLVTTQSEQDLQVSDELREEPQPEAHSTAIALERGSDTTSATAPGRGLVPADP